MTHVRGGACLKAASLLSVLAGSVILVSPPALSAQQEAQTAARVELQAAVRLTRIRGGTSFLAGATGLLATDPRFSFGGAGWVLLEELDIGTGTPGAGFKLRMAYGGVLTAFELLETPRAQVSVRTLWGAGNGKIVLPVSGTEIDADNFGVVEPEVTGTWHLGSFLNVGGGAAYRFVFGVEDLTGVSADHLRGLSVSLLLSARGF
jgi:hypothetical protein